MNLKYILILFFLNRSYIDRNLGIKICLRKFCKGIDKTKIYVKGKILIYFENDFYYINIIIKNI